MPAPVPQVTHPIAPKIIPRSEHVISPASINKNALQVLDQLRKAGFDSLLVGGCVRDLLLGREPKDFDVVTDALPEDVRRLFRRARLIGRRFRLAHVRMGRDVIEVATYRAAPGAEGLEADSGHAQTEAGLLLRDNVYGTRADDARRRDFTVNALYLDHEEGAIIDYVGGVDDIRNGVLRTIGEPETRLREDPVRMLRAVRFAAKLGFRIDPDTEAPIRSLAPTLRDVAPARLFEEVLKLFHGGAALATYELLRNYHLFEQLFPMTERSLEQEDQGFPLTLLPKALANTDARINEDKPVTPAFLFAALLWEPVRLEARALAEAGESEIGALQIAADRVITEQVRRVAIPKRFSVPAREIWSMQPRLANPSGRRAERLLAHKRFRAAYDFLLLRAECGEESPELAQWWTRYQEEDDGQREKMAQELPRQGTGRKRRRRRRPAARRE
jgi:poly(A) polymerase